ncbi:hypothetical protein E4K67_02425 [Desulfosporosinus fructosivorans]|uniref:Uncharacterized protein n=1 Tax=Desulfosporosinus fructosivorans TaxID=2018669 RepID=A0A4Z0RD04_9FIRM|nr:hypothetical protein [Desulfosporosinus fructosivorans]TGE39863.1 hypothetical protein E4K67_02425 [Desulfosporosinus fructosivorans]
MLTTQSKLTVQAPVSGERGTSFGDSILLKNTPTAIISNGDYRGKFAIRGSVGGFARPVLSPVSGVGRLNGSLLVCLRKRRRAV